MILQFTKGVLVKIDPMGMGQPNSSRARRPSRDLLARYRNPHLQRPAIKLQKSFCQNLVIGERYGPGRRIFLAAMQITFDFCPNMGIT